MAEHNSAPLILLAEQFAKLPGIGMKTAQRLAYFMLNMPLDDVMEFSDAVVRARTEVRNCAVCQNFTDSEICPICADVRRNDEVICVVESPKDLSAFERTGTYNGKYHVLHGLLSPVDGIGPSDIRIKELISRLSGEVSEVIMATNPTVEGEATAVYIGRLIKPMGIKVTRLAYGLPAGSALEFADDVTLQRALENRNEL